MNEPKPMLDANGNQMKLLGLPVFISEELEEAIKPVFGGSVWNVTVSSEKESAMKCYGCGNDVEEDEARRDKAEKPYCSQQCLDKYADTPVTVNEAKGCCGGGCEAKQSETKATFTMSSNQWPSTWGDPPKERPKVNIAMWTDQAREALNVATERARLDGSQLVQPCHLLYGMINSRKPKGISEAWRCLLDVSELKAVNLGSLNWTAMKCLVRLAEVSAVKPPLSDASVQVVRNATKYANQVCVGYVGTEHVLMTLVQTEGTKELFAEAGIGLNDLSIAMARVCPPKTPSYTLSTTTDSPKVTMGRKISEEDKNRLPGNYAFRERVGDVENTYTFQTSEEMLAFVGKLRFSNPAPICGETIMVNGEAAFKCGLPKGHNGACG